MTAYLIATRRHAAATSCLIPIYPFGCLFKAGTSGWMDGYEATRSESCIFVFVVVGFFFQIQHFVQISTDRQSVTLALFYHIDSCSQLVTSSLLVLMLGKLAHDD